MSDIYRPASMEVRLRALGHGFGMIVVAFVTGVLLFVGALNVLAIGGVVLPEESVGRYVLSSVAQFVGFILAGVGYLELQDEYDLVSIGRPSLRQVGLIVVGFVALYALNLVATIATLYFEIDTATNAVVAAGQANPELFLYMIPITVLLVAPGEELLFRGILQGWFRRAYGVVPGILLASLVFGGIHIVAVLGNGAMVYVVVAAALGLVLGALYEYTENLLVPIVVHGLWNAFLFTGQYLLAKGYITAPA